MAGNQKITFSFTGDSSGLRQAVNAAIRDLEKYTRAAANASANTSLSGSMKDAVSEMSKLHARVVSLTRTMDGFMGSKTIENFRDKFVKTAEIVSDVSKNFSGLGDSALRGSEAELDEYMQSLKSVSNLMDKIEDSNALTSRSMNGYALNLSNLNTRLKENADALTTSIMKTHGFQATISRIQKAASTVAENFKNMFRPFTQAASNFASTSDNQILAKMRAMISTLKQVTAQGTTTAGETSSQWQHVIDTFGSARSSLERFIYKLKNYDRIQKEVYKNEQKYVDYELKLHDYEYKSERVQKLLPFVSNKKEATKLQRSVGKKPKEVEYLTEDQIIDQLMASGVGKGANIGSSLMDLMRKVSQFSRPVKQIASTVFQSLSRAGNTVIQVMKNVGTSLTSAARNAISFATNTNVATAGLRGFFNIAKGLPSILKIVSSQILQLSTANFLAEATQQSIALVENLNLFTVSMGAAADEAQDFVDRMADLYGMNPSNLYRYAGYFAQITGAIGLTDKAAMTLSTSMTKMSNDIASLYNIEIEQVVENLGSGLQGLNQAVRKYGIDMRQTTIQQTAYKYGLTENVRTMSESNRVVLRYLTMIEQMRNAIKQTTTDFNGANKVIGDFARNIETPANQLRIFSEQIQQLATAIGTFLIPVVQKLLPILNGVVMAIRMILQFFATLFGIDALSWGGEVSAGSQDATDGLDQIGDAADSTGKKVKDLLAPFDELHILNEQLGSGSSGGTDLSDWGELDPRLLEALEKLKLDLDDIDMKAKDIRDRLLAIFGLTPDSELIPGGFLDKLIDLWNLGDWEGFGAELAKFFNQGIDWALENITWEKFEKDITDFLDRIIGIFNGFIKYFDWEGLGHVGANLVNILFHTIEEAIDRVEWAILGYQLAQMFNGLFRYIEWDLIGRTMAKGINAAFLELLGFVTGFDYSALANGIVEGINNAIAIVEPEIFGEALSRMFRGLISMLATIVNGVQIGELIDKIYGMFTRVFVGVAQKLDGDDSGWYILGNSLVAGLFNVIRGLNDAVAKWGDTGLTQAILDFLEGAIDAIDGSALYTAIDNIINGLLNFMVQFRSRLDVYEMTKEFVLWLGDVIKGVKISELLSEITGLVTDIFKGITDAFKIQKKEQGENLIHEFFEMIENMFKEFPWGDIGYVVGNFVGELIAHIISFFTSTEFFPFVTGFIQGIYDAFQQHPEVWQTIKDVIAFYLVGIVNGIPGSIAGPLAIVAGWISSTLRNFFENLFTGVGQWIQGFFTKLGGIIIAAFGDLMSKLPGKLGEIGKTIKEYGTQLKKDGREMMHSAFDGMYESIEIKGPELTTKFSPHAQKMIDEADKKFAQLPTIIEKHYSNVSEVSRTKLSEMQSYLSQRLDEITSNVNGSLTTIVADVEGNWHQIEITSETTWNDIYTTIKTEMQQSSEEVAARTEQIKEDIVNKIQYALDHISGLEWEETGVRGVQKLKGGFETEWGNFEVYVDQATGQIVQLIETILDSPTYSILANNLTSTFTNAFSTIVSNSATMAATVRSNMEAGMSLIENYKTQSVAAWQDLQNTVNQSKKTYEDAIKNSVMYTGNKTSTSTTSTNINIGNRRPSTSISTSTGVYFDQETKKWKFTGMATGGVVTGPTNAIIGEAGRAEAVIPLDHSPQMREFAQEVSTAVNNGLSMLQSFPGQIGGTQQPIDLTVKVQIGEKDWDAFIYESAEKGKRNVGGNPVEVRS